MARRQDSRASACRQIEAYPTSTAITPMTRPTSERDEILRRVSNFRAHQEKMAREREGYYLQARAKMLAFVDPNLTSLNSRESAPATAYHAERAADWAVRNIPETDSATRRNMFAGSAAYRNWAMKFPQQYYVGVDQERFKRKRPRRGAGSAGVPDDTTVTTISHFRRRT